MIYPSVFMRFARKVQPRNLLFFASTNVTAETGQLADIELLINENKGKKSIFIVFLDIKEKYLRALAETENVADVLTLALEAFDKEKQKNDKLENLREGVSMTKSVLLNVFAKHGIFPVFPQGEKFDPNMHDAVFESKYQPGCVDQVIKVGYHLHGRPIRPTKVSVVKD